MNEIIQGDCIEIMSGMDERSVDLVFGSPPYEDARTYGIDFHLKGQAWVDWMTKVFVASLRISRGLVAFVVEGRTRKFRYSATPILLMADLHRMGIHLRKPPVFHRVGIPGSGGPDWLRNDYEFIVCATNGGKLPWSDNTAMGHPPKFGPGGPPSHRTKDGTRACDKDPKRQSKVTQKDRKDKGSHRARRDAGQPYIPPEKSNPGNVISCGALGGGSMGDDMAHENEAPFPESLAEFFVQSFCPANGVVLDPFSGSGTTASVAAKTGRRYIGIDVRESQVRLSRDRVGAALNPTTYAKADIPEESSLFGKAT